MRLSGAVGLSGPQVWLPAVRQSAEDAVADGLVPAETATELGYPELPVADVPAPEMAVQAATNTLERCDVDAGELRQLLHAWIHYQGHDLWSPPHFVAHRLGADGAAPMGIQQVCNGGAAAVETAAARVLAEPEPWPVLVTTADAFDRRSFARWTADYGIAYGDGATSVLVHPLGAGGSDFVLRAVRTVAAPQLERMHRGADPFGAVPRSVSARIDVRRTKKAYLEETGLEAFTETSSRCLRAAVVSCLRDAGLAGDDPSLRQVALPRLGRRVLELAYLPVLAEVTPAKLLDLGAETGHLGAGDAVANLEWLWRTESLCVGEHALLISAGAGFTWSCLLVGRNR